MLQLEPIAVSLAAPTPHVEILGVFGAGKTTLAERLGAPGHACLLENHAANIFWGDAAALNGLGYLGYDLSFLLQHAHLVAASASARSPLSGPQIRICDWSFASDRLWASMRLGEEFAAYDAVFQALMQRIAPPIGYLYLRHPARVIIERIARRDRAEEGALRDYVMHAVERLDSLVAALPESKVIKVDDDVSPEAFGAQLMKWKTRT